MNTRFRFLCGALWFGAATGALPAQSTQVPPSSATVTTDGGATPQPAPADDAPKLAPEALDQLLAPIALYPDALVATILPASTYSSDVVLAARYLNNDGEVDQIEAQPWDQSVQSLAHYPEVVKWMDENLEWTQQLGDAYLAQQNDVMAAIQRDRKNARANGALVDTPQQKIVVDAAGNIAIEPAQPDVIYVPRYEPDIVYGPTPVIYALPPIDFGFGFRVGSWLVYDCDWGQRVVWVGDRHRWRPHDWHRPPPAPGRPPTNDWHAWQHRADRPHPWPHRRQPPGGWPPHDASAVPHPRPFPGAPGGRRGPGAGRPDHPDHVRPPGRPDDDGHHAGPRPAPPVNVTPPHPIPPPAAPHPGPSLEPGRPGSPPRPAPRPASRTGGQEPRATAHPRPHSEPDRGRRR